MAPEIKPPSKTPLFDRTHSKSKMPVYNENDTRSDDQDTSHFVCNSNFHDCVHTSRVCVAFSCRRRLKISRTVKQSRNGVLPTWGLNIPQRKEPHHVTKCYVMVRILKVQLKLQNFSTNDTVFPNLGHDILKHALKCAIFLRSML
jgi:hypothetical protein